MLFHQIGKTYYRRKKSKHYNTLPHHQAVLSDGEKAYAVRMSKFGFRAKS